MVPEARLERTEHGLVPEGDGWYVLNLRDAEWRHATGRGAVCVVVDEFEGERRDVQYGVNPFVLAPGEPMGMYHRETDQEGFLVVAGEAVLMVEGEERPLRAWDYFHCPPGTSHVIVSAGNSPCVVVAVGSRTRSEEPGALGFPVDEAARRHGASVAAATMDGGEAYASMPEREPTSYSDGWLPDC
jgi:mannose-6-phosphate isomerase-like protein (cupin superfamily)